MADELMKLWTFQHPDFVQQAQASGPTYTDWSRTPENWRLAYAWMSQQLRVHLSDQGLKTKDAAPIWCWHSSSRDDSRLTRWEAPPTDETVMSLLGGPVCAHGMVLLELWIPRELVLLSSYCLWNEFLDDVLETKQVDSSASFSAMFEPPYLAHRTDDIQAVIPYVESDWIRSTQTLNYEAKIANESRRLFCPEWQGFGEDQTVTAGAWAIKARLDALGHNWSTVTPSPQSDLKIEKGVLGLQSVKANLRAMRKILEAYSVPKAFLLGGTCGSEVVPASWVLQQGSDVALLWFDAHADLNTPASSPSGHFHGMPLRTLLGEGEEELVDLAYAHYPPENVILVGVRAMDPGEKQYVESHPIGWLRAAEATPDNLIRAIENTGCSKVYMHVDLDVLDSALFADVLVPEGNGVRPEVLWQMLQAVRENFDVCGGSLVEYVPRNGRGLDFAVQLAEVIFPDPEE